MTTTIVRRSERGGTTAELTAANEILEVDELCIELNVAGKRLMKIGDGVTHWLSLPYITADLTSPAHAVDVTASPGGSLSSTNVQAQLFELDGDVTAETAARTTAVTNEATTRASAITTEAAARVAGDALKIDKATATAQTVLGAIADGTPVAFPVGASHLFGRKAAGDLGQLTPAEAITILAVYTAAQTDTAISTQINALVAGSPGLLDTLKEIADALGDDPNFAATMTTALANKQPLNAALTAIAALTTQAYGRSLLTIASQGALMAALAGDAAFATGVATVTGTVTLASAGITSGVDAKATLAGLTGTLRVLSGETLYVNLAADLITPNLELEVMKGGQVKVDGAGKSFQVPLKGCPLRTLIDTSGTGVFVPTNQPLWHPVWWGTVYTADDAPVWRRAFAAVPFLGQAFFTGFVSGQKFALPIGGTKYADLDVPDGCDLGGVFGGTLVQVAVAASAYCMKFGSWSGIHDTYINSRLVSDKILIWLAGSRGYANTIYCDGSNLGAGGTFIKQGIAAGSAGNKIWEIYALGNGQGLGLDVEGSDFEADNVWFGRFKNNVVANYGAFMCNGLHTWGATLNGLVGGSDSSRFTNLYSETNGFDTGFWGGVSQGGWGADFTAGDGIVVEGYYLWHNANGMKFSRAGNRVITDGVISGGTTISSTQALFSARDINGPISGTGIPANTTILTYADDGQSATLSAASTNGAIASVTIGAGAAVSSTNNVLGAGVFNDNLDTGLEVDTTVFYCTGASFMSDAVKAGGSPVARRGIHCTTAVTSATIRAKGSNANFTQKLLVNDAGAGLDIELGRKRCVMTADLIDQSGSYTAATSFPYGYNDEWDLEALVTVSGSQVCDATVRFQPTGTNPDGYYGVFGALAGATVSASSTSAQTLNAARMNTTNPSGIVTGTLSTTLPQAVLLKGKFKAGTGTGDAGSLNLSLRAQSAAGAGALRTITDGVISGGTTLTSAAQASFTTNDVGRSLVGTGIPVGAYISAFTSATVVTISVASTNGAVASIDIGPGQTTFLKEGTVMTAIRRA